MMCPQIRIKLHRKFNRYVSIIKNPEIRLDQKRLLEDLKKFKNSEESRRFWLEMKRLDTKLTVQERCAEYVQEIAANEVGLLSIPAASTTTLENEPLLNPAQSGSEPYLFMDVDIADKFRQFQQAVRQETNDGTLYIESSVREVLSLSSILLLCPDQHSPLSMGIFTETVLSGLWKKGLNECLDTTLDISDTTCMTASRAIANVESGLQSKDEAELDLLIYGKTVDPLTRSLLRGICVGMRKLPLVAIKDKESIGECELFNMYFDPILSSLLSNPDKNVLLRWSNVISAESGDMRPDATISKIHQRSFGASLGYGEVKVARQRTDHHALCHDLLRLGIMTKDTLDQNKLEGALSFQIHGFHVSFFMTSLRHDGLYIMQEIGEVTFPRSLEELATFVLRAPG
ncbi:hypothetical protein [Absidia glauca]|uniref:Uncharacterized protein n=1 Tax=Absidia glauca TaxID=4829 RepID=A0A168LK82_ABSGL|nr:hypothetical protein [Absidia glauca]